MIVVLCGIDGCGKSTIGAALAKRMEALLLEFPDRSAVTGPLIDGYLKGSWGDEEGDALKFQALQVTNRMEHATTLYSIGRGLHPKYRHAVLVRYWQSGVVYGQLDGLDKGFLVKSQEHLPQADVNILLDIQPLLSLERCESRGTDLEKYEGHIEKMENIRRLYLDLWKERERPYKNWSVIDASLPIEHVLNQVIDTVIGSL